MLLTMKQRDAQITIRLSSKLREQLEREADGRALAKVIRQILIDNVGRRAMAREVPRLMPTVCVS
jgi:hypothetical protein